MILRALGKALALTLLVVAVLIGLTIALAATEKGSRWLLRTAAERVPGELTIEAIDGRLMQALELRGVRYRGAAALDIARLSLAWQPADLLGGTLHIQALELRRVHYSAPEPDEPPPEAPGPLEVPSLEMPLAVQLDRLEIRQLHTGDGDGPPLLERLMVSARASGDRLTLRHLELTAPQGQASASGDLQLAAPHTLDLELAWRMPIPGQAFHAAGRARVGGDLKAIELQHQLQAPVSLSSQGRLETPLERPHLALTTRWEDLTWPPQGHAVTSPAGQLQLSGWTGGYQLALEGELTARGVGAREIQVAAHGDLEGIHIERLAARMLDGRIEAAGELAWAPGLRWQLRTRAAGVDPRPLLPRAGGRIDATVISQGTPADYALQVGAELALDELPMRRVRLRAHGDRTGLRLENLYLAALDGDLEASGALAWAPEPSWDLAVAAQELDPSTWPGAPAGRLALTGQTSGELNEAGLNGQAHLQRLEGSLSGRPVSGQGRIEIAPGRLHSPGMALGVGDNRLQASGSWGERLDVAFEVDAPELSALWPALQGRIVGDGRLVGPLRQPELTLDVRGRSLGLAEHRIASLELEVERSDAQQTLRLAIRDAQIAGQAVQSAGVRARGTLAEHRLALTSEADIASLDTALAGGLREGVWRGQVEQLRLESAAAGSWRTQQGAAMTLGPGAMALEALCLTRDRAELCVQARTEAGGIAVEAEASRVPLALAEPRLPAGIRVKGLVDAQARIRGIGQGLEIEASLTPRPGEVRLERIAGLEEPLVVGYRETRLEAQYGKQGWRLEAAALLPDYGRLAARIRVGPGANTRALDGAIEAQVDDLRWLQAFTHEVRDPAGTVAIDLELAGTLAAPRIAGTASLSEGSAKLPTAGIELQAVSVSITSAGSRQLELQASARSGPGTLEARGSLTLDRAEGWPLSLELTGERFQALQLPTAQLQVSPELSLEVVRRQVDIQGTVEIPSARVQLKRPPPRSVAVSADEVIVRGDEAVAEKGSPWRVSSRIELVLGDDVRLEGFGLNARLAGRLQITDRPDKAVVAEGEIQVAEGQYKAYGQDLTIQEGRLIFQGPVDNPGLQVRAVRQVDDVTAGLRIAGTLKDPESTVFSEPDMPDQEATAYLLTGKPLSGASEQEANMLVEAVAKLGMARSGFITQRLAKTFDLEQVKLSSEGGFQASSLLIGKYLTPRLYVHYAVGLFERTQALSLEYELTRNLTLEATSGETQSMDLIYEIER